MAESSSTSFHKIIGRSAAMRALFADIEGFAPVDVQVLIRGESGTGKELVARAVQRLSRRRDRPFQTLNCADLTRELLRSKLAPSEEWRTGDAATRTVWSTVNRAVSLHLLPRDIGVLRVFGRESRLPLL